MRRYFRNLLMALLGRNPFQIELNEVKENLVSAAENVSMLNDMYFKLQEKMVAAEKWLIDYQSLVENLRERIKDKDEQLSQQARDYRTSLAEYEKRIQAYKLKLT
jgi:predicted  nucleic acid-binding Zn-ribbon protein